MTKRKAHGISPSRGRTSRRQAVQDWQLQDAKARFSELFRRARENGPQRVTKHGREAVVVLPAEEFARLTASQACQGSLVEFFAASPLCGSRIPLDRRRDLGREIRL
jgi:antitoxin Phd